MIGRALASLLLVFCLADAVVNFYASRIYDEFDFKGQASITIDDLCGDSCQIYASISPDSLKLASNLLIQLPKGFVSIADVAAGIDPVTTQKIPLIVNDTQKLMIMNTNAQLGAGPLVLYVINRYYKNIQDVEVYEAENFLRPVSTMPYYLTVMSARPFTLKQETNKHEGEGVLATMSGWDGMDEAFCPYLYYSLAEYFDGFTYEVNGPIISMTFDGYDFNKPPGQFTATIGITNKRKWEKSGWIGSAGYHGCPGKLPYRSSLYDVTTPFYGELTNYKEDKISIGVTTNSDPTHPVLLTDADTGAHYSFAQTADNKITVTFAHSKNITVTWTPDGSARTGFVAQWHTLAN